MIADVGGYTGDVPLLSRRSLSGSSNVGVAKEARASADSNLKVPPYSKHILTSRLTLPSLHIPPQWHLCSDSQPRRCAPPPARLSHSALQRSSATRPPVTTQVERREDRQAVPRAPPAMRQRSRMDRAT